MSFSAVKFFVFGLIFVLLANSNFTEARRIDDRSVKQRDDSVGLRNGPHLTLLEGQKKVPLLRELYAEPPAGAPNVEPPAGAPNAEPPTGEPNVDAPSGAPNVEFPAVAPYVESPAGAPNAKPPTGEPNVDAPSGAPNVESPAGAPNAKPPTGEPNVLTTTETTTEVLTTETTTLEPIKSTTEDFKGILSGDPDDIHFLLYPDPSNPDYYEEIIFNDTDSLYESSFDPALPLKVLTHGFLSDGFRSFPQNVKDAYLNQSAVKSYNVIIVDWGHLAEPQFGVLSAALYGVVVGNVERVGTRIGDFLLWLHNETNVDLESAHLVGHSLGSHVSGWAGKTVAEATGKPVARITALDPAGPLFYSNLVFRSIRPNDAEFIDAYYTNVILFGRPLNVGGDDVDFYINDGANQPGCLPLIGSTCSHGRAHQFFAQTILDGPPTEENDLKRCVYDSNWARMAKFCGEYRVVGEYCTPGTKGKFYFDEDFNEELAKEKAAKQTTTTTTAAPSS